MPSVEHLLYNLVGSHGRLCRRVQAEVCKDLVHTREDLAEDTRLELVRMNDRRVR